MGSVGSSNTGTGLVGGITSPSIFNKVDSILFQSRRYASADDGHGYARNWRIEMANETKSFCVVCVCGNAVVKAPFWAIEPEDKARNIALTVATAAETFGRSVFDVFVIDIAC